MRWTHLAFVESDSKPGKEYELERREDGVLRCSCEKFRFARGQLGTAGKTCKHLTAFHAGSALNLYGKHGGTSQLVTAGETFTFKRRFLVPSGD